MAGRMAVTFSLQVEQPFTFDCEGGIVCLYTRVNTQM